MKIAIYNYHGSGLTVWLENGEFNLPLGLSDLAIADPFDVNSTDVVWDNDGSWEYITVQDGGSVQFSAAGYEVGAPGATEENTLVAKDLLMEGFGWGAVTAGTMMMIVIVKKVLRQGPAYD